MVKSIPLSQGYVALVDDADHGWLAGFRWHVIVGQWNAYAVRKIDGHPVYMHREILSVLPGFYVDHIDGDGLNNTRANLRVATNALNQANTTAGRGASRYKGVSWIKPQRCWRAVIKIDQRQITLGRFDDEATAARAYDKAARAAWGSYARLNFPER